MLKWDIEKRFQGFHLQSSLETDEQVIVLFGPSGSGKSVTLQCLSGLQTPDAGQITIGGRVVFDARAGIDIPARLRGVGYVFQQYALFPHLSVAKNVGYGLHRLPAAERAARVADALRMVRLVERDAHLPGQLSGGEQQRVALARALVTRPAVLLLDEPFASLDRQLREQLREETLSLLHTVHIPTVLVTHDPDEARAFGGVLAVYDAGQVLQYGARAQVERHTASHRVRELIGDCAGEVSRKAYAGE